MFPIASPRGYVSLVVCLTLKPNFLHDYQCLFPWIYLVQIQQNWTSNNIMICINLLQHLAPIWIGNINKGLTALFYREKAL